jgi:hypothetical protein
MEPELEELDELDEDELLDDDDDDEPPLRRLQIYAAVSVAHWFAQLAGLVLGMFAEI